MKRKATIRVPTVQYGYFEYEFKGTPEEIIAEHNRSILLYNGGFGLEQKEFNAALDKYLTDGTGETEVYMQMSTAQQAVFQELKKAFKRIEARKK